MSTCNRLNCSSCDHSQFFSYHPCSICGVDFRCVGTSMTIEVPVPGHTLIYKHVCPVCESRVYKLLIELEENKFSCPDIS